MRFLLLVVVLSVAACGPNAAQREQIIATQAVVDQNIREGRMTPEAGRLAMATLKADMDAERRRNYAIATGGGNGVAVYQPMGGGVVIRY